MAVVALGKTLGFCLLLLILFYGAFYAKFYLHAWQGNA